MCFFKRDLNGIQGRIKGTCGVGPQVQMHFPHLWHAAADPFYFAIMNMNSPLAHTSPSTLASAWTT